MQEVEDTNMNEARPSTWNEGVTDSIPSDFAVKNKFAALKDDETDSEEVQNDGHDQRVVVELP